MPTTTTGLATSFIQFSRPGASGGGATVTDADGKIKWAGHNLLTNSESFDASAWNATSGVTVAANTTASPTGTVTADTLTFTSGGYRGQYAIFGAAVTGITMTGGMWLWTTSGKATILLRLCGVATGSDEAKLLVTLTTTPTLYTVSRTFTSADTAVSLSLDNRTAIGGDGIAGNVIAWGAHLYRSDLGGMQLNPAQPAGMQSYYPTTPRNLLGYSEDWSNAAWIKTNILAFGSGSVANAIAAPNGSLTADKIVESTANDVHVVRQDVTIVSGRNTFSVYLRAAERTRAIVTMTDNSSGDASIGIDLSTGLTFATGIAAGSWTSVSSSVVSAGDGWYRVQITGTRGAGTQTAPRVFLVQSGTTISYTGDGTSGIYLWGAQLSDSASLDAYSPVYGAAVTSAAYYAPRLDFDPVTLAARGLLVEEQRQNLIPYSNDFPSWFPTGATIATTGATAPDGTNNGNVVTITGTGASFFQSFTATAGLPYTASIWVKGTGASIGKSATFWFWYAGSATGTNTFAYITLTANWQRVTVTSTPTGGGQLFVRLDPEGINTATVGDVVHAYGAQVEQGSFATSFIPTIGNTTATRTADVASVSTGAFPYSASEGTIVVSAVVVNRKGSDYPRIAALYGTTVNEDNTVGIGQWSATALSGYVSVSGSPVADISQTVSAYGTNVKGALAYKVNDFAFSANGTAASTDTSGAVPSAATVLVLGSNTVNQIMNGHIRQITYIPRRLSNAELQSRSA